MADPRIETVLVVLREAGAQTNLDDTDTLATKIVNALDREHGAPDTETGTTAEGDAGTDASTTADPGNPETPAGTATEGGGAHAAE